MIAARDAARLLLVLVDISNQRLRMGFEHIEPDRRKIAPDRMPRRRIPGEPVAVRRTRSKSATPITADWPGYYCKRENDETAKPPGA
ncbi:hypothetical protein [Burkholderia lata]|uniref:hypothetical protein n=1 Tax=Burkholderia lata (strain ATCC 17760 / DSM 23089 / LMG 22485 / NCIMB 9086 / R18194 / 383) TaxID=482957 RepID=UPI00158239CD|nr:hypothetical protein [Burkholderia lata]